MFIVSFSFCGFTSLYRWSALQTLCANGKLVTTIPPHRLMSTRREIKCELRMSRSSLSSQCICRDVPAREYVRLLQKWIAAKFSFYPFSAPIGLLSLFSFTQSHHHTHSHTHTHTSHSSPPTDQLGALLPSSAKIVLTSLSAVAKRLLRVLAHIYYRHHEQYERQVCLPRSLSRTHTHTLTHTYTLVYIILPFFSSVFVARTQTHTHSLSLTLRLKPSLWRRGRLLTSSPPHLPPSRTPQKRRAN